MKPGLCQQAQNWAGRWQKLKWQQLKWQKSKGQQSKGPTLVQLSHTTSFTDSEEMKWWRQWSSVVGRPWGPRKARIICRNFRVHSTGFGERIFNNFFHRKTTEMQIYFTKELTEWLWLIMELWGFSFRLGLNMENFAAVIPCVSPPVGF